MSIFLTVDELVTLTGYRRPSFQRAYLVRKRIPHRVNGVGHPVVVAGATVGALPGAIIEMPPELDLRAIRGAE